MQLAERVGSPVVTTPGGAGILPAGHPLDAGVIGTGGTLELARDADMLIAVGTSFAALEDVRPDLPAQMIHVDRDPSQIGRVYPVRNGIAGDAAEALVRIVAAIEEAAPIQVLAETRAREAPQRAARSRGA